MTQFTTLFSKPVRLDRAAQLLVLVMALLIASSSLADTQTDEQNVNPNINQHMVDPNYQVWAQRFEHLGREVFKQREAIVKAVNIQPGMAIADIGAGTGLFTRLFAPAVGSQGSVYAVDIAKNFNTANFPRPGKINMTKVAAPEPLHLLYKKRKKDKSVRSID